MQLGSGRMRRYALYLGYVYAIYVTLNLALFSARNPPPASQSEMIFGIVYIVIALALSWGTAILLTRRKVDLQWRASTVSDVAVATDFGDCYSGGTAKCSSPTGRGSYGSVL